MPKVNVNDIQMYYEVKGRGFPLVMIMGMNNTMETWDPRLVEGLSKHFKLVLFDNCGVGRTDISKGEYTIKRFADDTAGLMKALRISKAHVLGISMGGMIAQELALNYPEKVSKLVLCSTSSHYRFDEYNSKVMEAADRGCSLEELTKLILSFPFARDYPKDFLREHPGWVFGFTSDFVKENPDLAKLLIQRAEENPISPEVLSHQHGAVLGFNAQARLKHVKAPTLVLHGRKDVSVPPENGSTLAKAIPKAKLVYFEKSNHMLAEEMGDVIHVLTDFLL